MTSFASAPDRIDAILRYRPCGRISTDPFAGFLAGLRVGFGRVLLFAGNA